MSHYERGNRGFRIGKLLSDHVIGPMYRASKRKRTGTSKRYVKRRRITRGKRLLRQPRRSYRRTALRARRRMRRGKSSRSGYRSILSNPPFNASMLVRNVKQQINWYSVHSRNDPNTVGIIINSIDPNMITHSPTYNPAYWLQGVFPGPLGPGNVWTISAKGPGNFDPTPITDVARVWLKAIRFQFNLIVDSHILSNVKFHLKIIKRKKMLASASAAQVLMNPWGTDYTQRDFNIIYSKTIWFGNRDMQPTTLTNQVRKKMNFTIPFKRFHYTKENKIPSGTAAHQNEWTAGQDDAYMLYYGFYNQDGTDATIGSTAEVAMYRYFCKLPFAQAVEQY